MKRCDEALNASSLPFKCLRIEAMNPSGNFPKNALFSVDFFTKPKNIVVLAFTNVLESFALFFGNFCMDIHSVDSDEARR
jgi:hypothetical protein